MILLNISAIPTYIPQLLDLVLIVFYLLICILQLLLCGFRLELGQSISILWFDIGFVEHSLYLLDFRHQTLVFLL